MMAQTLRLNDVIPDWPTAGIFAALQSRHPPWEDENIASSLDLAYHGARSGGKPIAPIVERMLAASETTVLSSAQCGTLAQMLLSIYGPSWSREYATLSAQYSPLSNYDMEERGTNDQTVTAYGHTTSDAASAQHTKTGTDTLTDNLTTTTTPNLTTNNSHATYGFNSSSAAPADEDSSTTTGTSTDARTGTETRAYDLTDADAASRTVTEGGQDTRTRNYLLTRRGNIGVTTSQQMLESERDVWMWNYFRDVVFRDVDATLTLSIY